MEFYSLGIAVRSILLAYEWDQFALLYSNVQDKDMSCSAVRNDLQSVVNRYDDITINFVANIMEISLEYIKKVMRSVWARARIVVVCVPEDVKREFLLHVMDSGYLTDDFVYILADTDSTGF
ncbi:hypothetical protein GCK32_020208, partial [Trichostrongylus colubriformis]